MSAFERALNSMSYRIVSYRNLDVVLRMLCPKWNAWDAQYSGYLRLLLRRVVNTEKHNRNKSMFSLVPRLLTWHYPHSLLSAVLGRRCCLTRMQLVRGANAHRCRSISPALEALSSKPTGHRCCTRSMGQTDRLTLDRFIDPAPHTMRAVLIMQNRTMTEVQD